MDVKYGLAAVASAVHNGAVAVCGEAFGASDVARGEIEPADQLGMGVVEVVDGGDVLARDHQAVKRGLRVEVAEGDYVVVLVQQVGGDLAEILEQVGETIRARTRIKRQVDALTAEGKISALVLFCLPFGLGFFIFSSNPSYIEPLYTTGVGYVMMGAIAFMLTVGGLWLRKLVNPEF